MAFMRRESTARAGPLMRTRWGFASRRVRAYGRSLQIEACVQLLLVSQLERPVFDVMVRADDRKHEMLQVDRLRAAGDVGELEIHRLGVRRTSSHQSGPIAGLAVVNQGQTITLHVDHGRLGDSSWRDLMLEDASSRGHAHRYLDRPLDVRIVRIGGSRAGPGSRQSPQDA